MRRRAFRTCLVLVALASWSSRARAADVPERAAEASATAWLAVVDSGRYGQSWDEAAALFRQSLSRAQWEEALEKARRPLGKALSRKLLGAKFLTRIPNGPAGEYVVLQFDTRFENKPSAVETITPMKDKDGAWRVSGYYIR